MSGIDVIVWVVLTGITLACCYCCPFCFKKIKARRKNATHDEDSSRLQAGTVVGGSAGDVEAGQPVQLEMQHMKSGDPATPAADANDNDDAHAPSLPSAGKPAQAGSGSSPQATSSSAWGRSEWLKFVVKLIASAVFAYFFLCAVIAIYVAVAANSLTFEPVEASDCVGGDGHYDCSYTTPNPTFGVEFESVDFTSTVGPGSGELINAFYMENTTFPAGRDGEWINILYNHGSGRNIAVNYRMDRYKFLLSLGGVRLLSYDYPGYGKSSGDPDQDTVRSAANAALTYFMSRVGAADSSEIVYLGRSLGGGVASWLARYQKPRALILQSTFADLKETAADGFLITAWAIESAYGSKIDFDSEKNLRGYDNCYYQSHSADDEVVPYDDGKKLFDSMDHVPLSPPGCKTFVRTVDLKHDDPLSQLEKTKLSEFVDLVRLPSTP